MHDNIQLPTYELPVPDFTDNPSASNAEPPALRTVHLRFPGITLYPRLIPRWRGAVIESAGTCLSATEADMFSVFHNHLDEGAGTLHRPALIHYRAAQNSAILWGMNEGADALLRWQSEAPEHIVMGGARYALNPVEMRRSRQALNQSEGWHYYRLHDYLALNPENYARFMAEHRLRARTELLENTLAAHLLAFCQGAGWYLPQRLEIDLVELHGYKKTRFHNVDLLAFELTYRCNLALPDEIALGKAVSHGFGVQRKAPKYS